jgi:uncharacterized coiled-coil DUF342 family protein
MDFSPKKLTAHFHDLTARRAKIDAKLDPLRRQLNELVSKDSYSRKEEDRLRKQIVKLQLELAPIEDERAVVSRAVAGKTGVPEGVEFGHSL